MFSCGAEAPSFLKGPNPKEDSTPSAHYAPFIPYSPAKAIDPLSHQISAVYKEMLPKMPLRYVLADDPGIVEMLVYPIVERKAHNSRRYAPDDDHPPQPPGAFALSGRLAPTERVELVEVKDDDGHDGADLYDGQKHGEKRI